MTDTLQTGLPSSVQTEITVLGAMLLDGVAIVDATAMLEPYDFMLDSHQRIYRAIREMAAKGEPVDLITVIEHMGGFGSTAIKAVGGESYFAHLTTGIPRNPNIASYVRIIRQKSLLRQMQNIFNDGLVKASDEREDPQELLSDIEAKLHKLGSNATQQPSLDDQSEAEFERMEKERRGEVAVCIPSGLSILDEANGGYAIGEMTLLAAWPSVGKSTALRQAIMTNCTRGNFCHLFTPEMRAGKVLRCLWATMAQVPYSSVRHPVRMSAEQHRLIQSVKQDVAEWPLLIDDARTMPNMNPAAVIARARRVKLQHNTKLTGLDYLQQLKFDGNSMNRAAEISAAGWALADLAKEGSALVVVSSLTEGDGKKANQLPSKFNLRGSGDLQYAADSIYLLHREMDAETRKLVPETLLIADKARSDGTGSQKMYFNGQMQVFEDSETFQARMRI